MICDKCKNIIVLHAMSQGTCEICSGPADGPHLPEYIICYECSEENNACQQCGEFIPLDDGTGINNVGD